MGASERVVFLNGTFGVGKSSVLDHIGDLMAEQGRPFALFDVDWFHRSWPVAPDDLDNVRVEAVNIAAVWANYRTAGPRTPFIAGVLRTSDDRARYERAFGLPVLSVLLRAQPGTIEQRLRRRYPSGREDALRWHLERYRALADELDRAALDEVVVDTDDINPREVAERVITLTRSYQI